MRSRQDQGRPVGPTRSATAGGNAVSPGRASATAPDPVKRFGRELEDVQGRLIDARGSRQALVEALGEILRETSAGRIHWETPELLTRSGLIDGLGGERLFGHRRLVFSRHPEGSLAAPVRLASEPRNHRTLKAVEMAVSAARWGIAETGTVVHQSGPGVGRLLSALAPNHVLFLARDALLETHEEFFARYCSGERGSAALMITGPSRTADIEKRLVVGVHGPKRLFVILTD